MKNIFYILFILPIFIFGQNKVGDSCVLQLENIKWKKTFENATSKKSKLELILNKIINDSTYKVYKPKIHIAGSLYPKSFDKDGNDCGVKILFILNYSKKESIILDLSKNPKYNFITNQLSDENIKNIQTVFDSNSAQSLYGTLGKSGVVLLTTDNKNFIKQIREFLKKERAKNK